jgi:hypothetical protein
MRNLKQQLKCLQTWILTSLQLEKLLELNKE